MTLEQLIILLQAIRTDDNKDLKIVMYTGIEVEASIIRDDQECITIY